MPIPDDTLIAAMADAAEGRGVLVVTPLASETDAIVAKAKALTIENLIRANFSKDEAKAYILFGSNPWQVRLRSNGWVFFFPLHELKPNDDVGNPAYVYAPGSKGRYEKLPYLRWRTLQVATTANEEPPKVEEPKSAWGRLLEDDE